MWSRFFSNYSISFPLQGSKTCRYRCYRRMWRDAILVEEQMWAAVEAILKQLEICIASLRRDCRFIFIQKNLCLDLLGIQQGLRMIWRYINDWMFLKNNEEWLDSDWNGRITWTYFIYLQSHFDDWTCARCSDVGAAIWAGWGGIQIGKCLSTSQRRNTGQIIIEVTSNLYISPKPVLHRAQLPVVVLPFQFFNDHCHHMKRDDKLAGSSGPVLVHTFD